MRVAAVVVLGVSSLLVGCGPALCGNTISQSVASPSGKLKAVVFDRNCGATTGFNTQLSVLKANSDLREDGGNALILDDTISIELTWKSETFLVVSGLADAHVFKSEAEVEGVHLSFVK